MLSIATWNAQGSNDIYSARHDLMNIFDIILLQEVAGLDDTAGPIKDHLGSYQGGTKSRPGVHYSLIYNCWHGGYQGATAIYYRTALGVTSAGHIDNPNDSTKRGITYIELNGGTGQSSIIIGTIHAWSPNGNDWDKITNNLKDEVKAQFQNSTIIIGGDFNAAAAREAKNGNFISPGATHDSGGQLDGFWIHNAPIACTYTTGIISISHKSDHNAVGMNIQLN